MYCVGVWGVMVWFLGLWCVVCGAVVCGVVVYWAVVSRAVVRGGAVPRAGWWGGPWGAPPCHRRMVITTLFSVFLAALQRRPVVYHTTWLLTML